MCRSSRHTESTVSKSTLWAVYDNTYFIIKKERVNMKLSTLTETLEFKLIQGTMDKDVEALIYFSDKAVQDCAFFAIAGARKDGYCFIEDAVTRGARTVILDQSHQGQALDDLRKRLFDDVTILQVDDVRIALAIMSRNFFGRPCEEMIVIGVTGTKGKTSTTYMIKEILEAGGIKTGLIGTVENGFKGHMEEAEHTTPMSYEIQKWCRRMKDAGCKAVVMEVSSQGLMQYRVEGITFDLGIFTNISPDHIGEGEHKDFEEYLYWKSTLFKKCKTAIMNIDDPNWRNILGDHVPENLITFGYDPKADYHINHCRLLSRKGFLGLRYMINGQRIHLNIPGTFNSLNSAGAIAAARCLGVDWRRIKTVLREIKIRGRVERVEIGKDFTILVDYAHNGVALERLLTSLRNYGPKRLLVVFGCGGNLSLIHI